MSRVIQEEQTTKYAPAEELEKPKQLSTCASEAMSIYEDLFIRFVQEQVVKMDEKLLFDGTTSPPLQLIDRAIMQHEHVMLALTAMYEQARWDLKAAKAHFEEWYAEAFLKVRNEVNKTELSASKWYTKDEIDYMVTCKHKAERAELKAQIELADGKVSLFRRLIDSWNSYAFQLGQLSRNGIAEKNSNDMIDKCEDLDPVVLSQRVMNTN